MNDISLLPRVIVDGTSVPVELAMTDDAIKKGLSGRPSLDPESGMLFIFPKPAQYRFWMRDMRFPIDIVWIDAHTVISVDMNVSTQFDNIIPLRQSPLRWLLRRRRPIFYMPPQPAQYILEVNAGFATKHNIARGNDVLFRNIPLLS